MHIYGHCPAHDDIYLVVCSHCGQVVKPQAFEKHCERRHGPITIPCSPSSDPSFQKQPLSGRSTSELSISTEKQTGGRGHDTRACFSKAPPVNRPRPTKGTERYFLKLFSCYIEKRLTIWKLWYPVPKFWFYTGLDFFKYLVLNKVTLMLTHFPTSAVLQWRHFLRRPLLPFIFTPPPRLALGFPLGTQGCWPLASLSPPHLCQRDPLHRSPQLDSSLRLRVLCGEWEPTAGWTKTAMVSQHLFIFSCYLSALLLAV